MRDVENLFWKVRFQDYTRWKERWYEQYRSQGYFDTLTGFRVSGDLSRNQVLNSPVQGSAFHCLLWSLIELQKELDKRRMRTLLVGQIHDSIMADVPLDETQSFLDLAQEVMTKRLRKAWDWIIVPLEIEAELSEVDGSWADLHEWTKKGDGWSPVA